MADHWTVSLTMISCIIFVVDLKLALHTKTWTLANWFALIVGSIFIYFLFVALGDSILLFGFHSYKTAYATFTSFMFWLILFISLMLTHFFDSFRNVITREFFRPLWNDFSRLINK